MGCLPLLREYAIAQCAPGGDPGSASADDPHRLTPLTPPTPLNPIILASRSPRRQEALAALGVPFEVQVSEVEASLPQPDDPTDPVPIAAAKALDVAARQPNRVILAGDTIVVLDHVGLGKPESPAAAVAMLAALRGRRHVVRSAIALINPDDLSTAEVACPLLMRKYSEEEIERYVASGEPLDCAGAYDVHRLGGALVERVEGCFSTVVGLPIMETAARLRAAGVGVPADPAAVCTELYGRRCLAADPATAGACRSARR